MELWTPAAWDQYLAHLTAPPAQPATQLPAPHTPQLPPAPASCLDQPITEAEIEVALQKLHNGRFGAILGYPSALLRYPKLVPADADPAPEHLLLPWLQMLFNTAFSSGTVPQSWKTSLVTPMFKRGDATDTANYRPIAVGGPLSRLYASILVQHLVQYTEQRGLRFPTQAGYRPGHSTIHQTFVLQHVIDKHRRRKFPLYLCFVDLNLHDRVQCQLLWDLLCWLGVQGTMLGAIQSMYDGCLLSMRVNGVTGDSQPPSTGLRQGCPPGATLFGLFIDGLDHYLETVVPTAGIQILQMRLRELVYADDICLLASSPEQLQALINVLAAYCATLQMETIISVPKTKVMVVSTVPAPVVTFTCNGNPVEQVATFKYLGLRFHQSGSIAHLVMPIKSKAGGSWAAVATSFIASVRRYHQPAFAFVAGYPGACLTVWVSDLGYA